MLRTISGCVENKKTQPQPKIIVSQKNLYKEDKSACETQDLLKLITYTRKHQARNLSSLSIDWLRGAPFKI